jgi:hypothetical protein
VTHSFERILLQDLGSQLKTRILQYYADEKLRTCKECGTIDTAPTKKTQPEVVETGKKRVKQYKDGLPGLRSKSHPSPFNFIDFIKAKREEFERGGSATVSVYPDTSATMFEVNIAFGEQAFTGSLSASSTEEWYWQLEGTCTIRVQQDNQTTQDMELLPGVSYLLPPGTKRDIYRSTASTGLVVKNRCNVLEKNTKI